MEITFEKLKNSGYKPRVHPNGFIQLDLSDTLRLHIWLKEPLIKSAADTPMHDHIFSFDSFVMHGQIGNILYDIEPSDEGLFDLYKTSTFKAIPKEVPLELMQGKYNIKKIKEFWTSAGEIYHMEPFVFHETLVKDFSITVIRILPFDKTKPARVLCKADTKPDQDFKRSSIEESILWSNIEKAIQISQHRVLPDGWN